MPHVTAISLAQVTLRREQFLEECDLQGLEFSDPPQTPFSMLSSESNEASRKENAVEFSVVWSVFDRLTIRHRLSHAPSQAGEFTTTALGSKPPRHSHPDSEASLSEDDVSADRGTRHRYHGWEASQFSPPVNARVALYSKDDVPLGQWLLQVFPHQESWSLFESSGVRLIYGAVLCPGHHDESRALGSHLPSLAEAACGAQPGAPGNYISHTSRVGKTPAQCYQLNSVRGSGKPNNILAKLHTWWNVSACLR